MVVKKTNRSLLKARRTFLKQGSLSLLALSVPVAPGCKNRVYRELAIEKPESAVVVWYSQTGNTERAGRVIARTLEKQGLRVDAFEYRQMERSALKKYDLIIAGSPVYYYDVPENFKKWLGDMPDISGRPVAVYTTYGGTGGNQHNAACTLLALLADNGGVPVGLHTFGNMSTFALTWSAGNAGQVLKYKNNPNPETYAAMRAYACSVLDVTRSGQSLKVDKEFNLRELIKTDLSIWGTKLFIGKHTIDQEKCVGCQTCVEKCPVGAIDLARYHVDTDRCIACLGCVNNCPEQAFDMEFMGRQVYGYNEFKRRHNIIIPNPL